MVVFCNPLNQRHCLRCLATYKLIGQLLVVILLLIVGCVEEPVAALQRANPDPSSSLGAQITAFGETQDLLAQTYPRRDADWPRWLRLPEYTYGQGNLVTSIIPSANPDYHSIGFTNADPDDLREYFLSLFPNEFKLSKTNTKQDDNGNYNSVYVLERNADRYRIIIDIAHGTAFGDLSEYSVACFKDASVSLDLIN